MCYDKESIDLNRATGVVMAEVGVNCSGNSEINDPTDEYQIGVSEWLPMTTWGHPHPGGTQGRWGVPIRLISRRRIRNLFFTGS